MSRERTRVTMAAASAEIPTSSMADIAFFLVVYFMLTVTFASTRGLDFRLPNDDPIDVEPVESVLVEVLADDGLRVDGRAMRCDELLEYLRPRLAQNPEKPVILAADAAASYGAMLGVYDLLRQGKDRLGLDDEIVVAIPTRQEIVRYWQ